MQQILHNFIAMYVYLIGEKGAYLDRYKIGKASNVERRLKQLQTGNPRELHVVASKSFKDAYYIESKLHYALASRRKRGEWFRLTPLQLKWVAYRLGSKKRLPFILLLDKHLTIW